MKTILALFEARGAAAEMAPGHAMELRVDQRLQTVKGGLVAVIPHRYVLARQKRDRTPRWLLDVR